jgi:enoyl-CoA hydratase
MDRGMERIRLEMHEDGLAILTLTDPTRRNAMGKEMGAELRDVAASLQGDPHAHALVVTGEGKAFCAGADLPQLFGDPDRPTTAVHEGLREYYRAFLDLRDLRIPTIAAVNGPAIGAGLNLALACDMRIAGERATFGATFARIGLHPGGGCTWFLVQTLGSARALRVLLRAEAISAEEAVALGLADGPVADPLVAAVTLAREFLQVDPVLAQHIKKAVRLAEQTGDLDAVLAYESWAQAASVASPQLQAWVDRFRGS